MNASQLLVSTLEGSFRIMKSTLADFSDADLLTRPLPNANHPNWQLGHLLKSETNLLSMVGAAMPALPPEFAAAYTNDTAGSTDTAAFLKKDQLLAQFEKTRAASIAFAKSLTPEQLAAAVPGDLGKWFPTVAELIAMVNSHTIMHIGQIQVARRKLNKPILM